MAERKIKIKYEVNNISVCEEKKLEEYKQQSGVYILRDKGGNALYIGEAKRLSPRVKKHLHGKDLATQVLNGHKYIYSVDLYLLDSSEPPIKRKMLEIDLVLKLDPPFNSQFTDRHGDKPLVYETKDKYIKSVQKKSYKITEWTAYEKKAYFERSDIASIVIDEVLNILYNKHEIIDREATLKKYLDNMKIYNNQEVSDVLAEALRIGTKGSHVTRESLKELIPKNKPNLRNHYSQTTTDTVLWWSDKDPSGRRPR
ncbi:GIY-YIG nuclease family protein [Bacillus cereus]|uniref:GIY-YIG nuclease family protein n=1 Tax=Bacillus cereus TaxID=1396 RepID=UPI000D12B2DB|nr:GIY-YIG nuclease family protein [Bacillus cereus]AVR33502.1 hypothetical protein FORC60_3679 [Bacillus cereus]MEB9416652.1 GIY-YIG nuclease family protein [Bacillus cereus]MEB9445267.1 GIY-YIG nuclease family protein [Bacillus cereus]